MLFVPKHAITSARFDDDGDDYGGSAHNVVVPIFQVKIEKINELG